MWRCADAISVWGVITTMLAQSVTIIAQSAGELDANCSTDKAEGTNSPWSSGSRSSDALHDKGEQPRLDSFWCPLMSGTQMDIRPADHVEKDGSQLIAISWEQ